MKEKIRIIDITKDILTDHTDIICYINPKHEHYHHKIDWLKKRFKEGLKIKLLYLEGVKKPVGFIEYVPGEYCWRPVEAKGYMFIHCLWTNGKKYQHQGLGTLLIEDVEKDATDMAGVAIVTSDKSFMATREIFLKNGYKIVSESGKEQLIAKQFKEGSFPSINNWESELEKSQGLTIIYSKQCPWVARFIEEVKPILQKEGLTPEIIELRSADEAQKAPSLYGIFNLIYDGKILADRYISTTRFINIVKKEIQPKAKK